VPALLGGAPVAVGRRLPRRAAHLPHWRGQRVLAGRRARRAVPLAIVRRCDETNSARQLI